MDSLKRLWNIVIAPLAEHTDQTFMDSDASEAFQILLMSSFAAGKM
jgi:hypothetical protein